MMHHLTNNKICNINDAAQKRRRMLRKAVKQMLYTCPKTDFSKMNISSMYLFFMNGDYVSIEKNEILGVSIRLYDSLVSSGNAFSPIAESGTIRLRIQKVAPKGGCHVVYNENEFRKGRKLYIEKRCAVEGELSHVWFLDKNCWHRELYGDLAAHIDGGELVLEFLPSRLPKPADAAHHSISLAPINDVEKIHRIDLSFENCESFTVYQSEIADIQLHFSKELIWDSSSYIRNAVAGYIRLRIDPDYNREACLSANWRYPNVPATKARLEKRLCGNGIDNVDICHLYVHYMHPGYGNLLEEKIDFPQLYDKRRTDEEYDPEYVTGYAKRQADGSILITFGKRLKRCVRKK